MSKDEGRKRRRIGRLISLAVLLIAGLVLYPRARQHLEASSQADGGALVASGVVQADEILVSGPYGGRIVQVMAQEGDSVQAGDPLVQLDTRLLDAQIAIAEAGLELARAQLDRTLAGARPGQIAIAEAQLAQAKVAVGVAAQAVSDTITLRDNPQDLQVKIAVAQAQLESEQGRLGETQARHIAAADAMDAYVDAGPNLGPQVVTVFEGSVGDLPGDLPPELVDWIRQQGNGTYTWRDWEITKEGDRITIRRHVVVSLPPGAHLIPFVYRQSLVGLEAAEQSLQGARAQLYHLYALWNNPVEAETRIHQAEAALAQALAARELAQAQLDGYQAGATPEQVALAQAQVEGKQAALDVLLAQRTLMTLTAPADGVLLEQVAQVYELVGAGAPIFVLADLSQVSLKVYVPANRLGEVHLGQVAGVQVDSYPNQVFEGRVVHVADQAEFTPRNVATREERVNTVYAVEIRLPNPDGALKPGMPADVVFGEAGDR